MKFLFGRKDSCFLKNILLLSLAVSTLCVPVVNAANYTLSEAEAQVSTWKNQAELATQAGKTAEAAEAMAVVRTWEGIAQQLRAAAPSQAPAPASAAAVAPAVEQSRPMTDAERAAIKAKEAQDAAERARLEQERAKGDRLKSGLATAVTGGDYNQAKSFITQGAVATPELVQLAVDGGYTGIAYLLMKSGAEIGPSVLGKALLRAVQMQDRDRVNNLIKLGANVNYSESTVTPLSIAARNGDLGLIGILLAAGATRDATDLGRVMFQAVQQGERDKVANLLKMGANANYAQDGTTALSNALDRGDFGMASVLISGGSASDPRVLGSALYKAVEKGNTADVDQLLRLKADVNYSVSGTTPLTIAIGSGNLDIANQLIRAGGTDPSGRYGKKTFEAALAGDMAWINVLAKVESYANYRNGVGETPLHAAASTGQTGAVAALLQAGVPADILTVKNWTPLHHAARFGHQLALMHLLKAGADVYAVNSDGNDAYKLAGLAMRDAKNSIDSQGVLNYLKLWMQFHPRTQ